MQHCRFPVYMGLGHSQLCLILGRKGSLKKIINYNWSSTRLTHLCSKFIFKKYFYSDGGDGLIFVWSLIGSISSMYILGGSFLLNARTHIIQCRGLSPPNPDWKKREHERNSLKKRENENGGRSFQVVVVPQKLRMKRLGLRMEIPDMASSLVCSVLLGSWGEGIVDTDACVYLRLSQPDVKRFCVRATLHKSLSFHLPLIIKIQLKVTTDW